MSVLILSWPPNKIDTTTVHEGQTGSAQSNTFKKWTGLLKKNKSFFKKWAWGGERGMLLINGDKVSVI